MAARLTVINAGIAIWHTRAGAKRLRRRFTSKGRFSRRPWGGGALTRFDPYDRAVQIDPYPGYRDLLAGPHVHYNRRRAVWFLARYDDVRAGARAHDVLSSAESIAPYRVHLPMMITSDRPEHTRLRRLVTREFTHNAVESQRPAIERLAEESVGRMVAARECDAAELLASPLPVMVIARVLGIPEADFPAFRDWSDKLVKAFALRRGPAALRDSADVLGSGIRLYAYMQGQFERLRRSPGEDVLSGLVACSDEGDLTPDELYWFAFMLLLAGNETTTSLLGTMLLAFAQHPDQFARLREEPDLIASAVEEALRHGSPIQGLYRTATAHHEVGDCQIPAGGRVLLLFGAANRDPRHYSEPDAFDVARNPTDHLAFGGGIHFCLGAHLARIEGQVVLRELVDRVERIEPAGKPRWNGNASVRGLNRLPLRLVPA